MVSYLIELLGTAFLVYIIFATGNYMAVGAALALIVLLGGPVSGGAYNPAVALSLYASGRIGKIDLGAYILAEMIGGLIGYYLYKSFVM
jgi:glycerol uptake facilitator-like aquaporin